MWPSGHTAAWMTLSTSRTLGCSLHTGTSVCAQSEGLLCFLYLYNYACMPKLNFGHDLCIDNMFSVLAWPCDFWPFNEKSYHISEMGDKHLLFSLWPTLKLRSSRLGNALRTWSDHFFQHTTVLRHFGGHKNKRLSMCITFNSRRKHYEKKTNKSQALY